MVSEALGLSHERRFTWENLEYPKFIHRFFVRINLLFSDGLVCGNSAGATIHRRYTRKPIVVIPMNGLDPELFKPNSDVRAGSEMAGKIVYTFVGAIGYRKGIHHILNALPKVLVDVPSAHVIIAGRGEYEPNIKQLADGPLIRPHVTLLPWIDHDKLVRLLSVSDVFLYPSIPHGGWTEQFGYSMAEASLMELPIIATRSGSIPDVVVDGQTGILVPPDDADALADAMIQLGSDENLRHRLGESGRAYIVEHFSHAVIARQFFEFLNRI